MRNKRNRKLVSILLTLSLLVAMLVPMTAAFASTTNTTTSTPNETQPFYGQLTPIKIDGMSITSEDQVQVLLPSGVSFDFAGYTAANYMTALNNALTAGTVAGNCYTDDANKNGVGKSTDRYNSGINIANALKDPNAPHAYNTTANNVLYAPQFVPSSSAYNGVYIGQVKTLQPKLLAFTVDSNGNGNGGSIRINLPLAVTTASTGPIKVTVQDTNGSVTAGTVTVGNVVTGGTTTTVTSTASMAQNGSDHVTFLINENSATALGGGGNFYVDLPSHFTWSFAPGGTDGVSLAGGFSGNEVVTNATTVTGGDIGVSITQNSSGNSRMQFTVNNRSVTLPGTIQVTALVQADNSASIGDITATFGGTDPAFTAATATVGTCGSYGVTATAGTQPTLYTGQAGQTVGTFTIAESVANTLINGRMITLTLPGGVRWVNGNLPVPTIMSGSISSLMSPAPTLSGDRTSVSYTVTNVPTGGSASTIQFSQGEVDLDTGIQAGTLTATVSGSGIQSTTVDIGKISSPVAATASATPNVVIGQSSQAAGDMTIVEAAPGAIMAQTAAGGITDPGYLEIIAPSGVTFAGVPTVKVTSGDLNLNASGATLTGYNGVLNDDIKIPVSNGSTKASTISITGLQLNLDNTVPSGPVALVLGGSALITPTITYSQTVNNLNVNVTVPATPINGTYVTSVPVATCTSSVTKTTGGTATFKIGDTKFTMNGVDQTMDAAPYLKNDRTYLPIRFVAQAVGVSDSNIIWNSDDQSVTLIKGGSVVRLVIGSTTMTINGTAITMDTAPEIVDPGRTMLPVSWVAKALGANITWDAATQTVTVN